MKRYTSSLSGMLLTIAALMVACASPGAPTSPQITPAAVCPSCTIIPSPNSGTSDDFYGVAALTSQDAWAVGYYSTYFKNSNHEYALIEHWNGSQWSLVSRPQPGSGFTILTSIAAISSS